MHTDGQVHILNTSIEDYTYSNPGGVHRYWYVDALFMDADGQINGKCHNYIKRIKMVLPLGN